MAKVSADDDEAAQSASRRNVAILTFVLVAFLAETGVWLITRAEGLGCGVMLSVAEKKKKKKRKKKKEKKKT